eukprot:Hpha_TRINITY_DN7738_c0_g1::TRINITY_DN7738_c0_g1_i1::g.85279::m.85279
MRQRTEARYWRRVGVRKLMPGDTQDSGSSFWDAIAPAAAAATEPGGFGLTLPEIYAMRVPVPLESTAEGGESQDQDYYASGRGKDGLTGAAIHADAIVRRLHRAGFPAAPVPPDPDLPDDATITVIALAPKALVRALASVLQKATHLAARGEPAPATPEELSSGLTLYARSAAVKKGWVLAAGGELWSELTGIVTAVSLQQSPPSTAPSEATQRFVSVAVSVLSTPTRMCE